MTRFPQKAYFPQSQEQEDIFQTVLAHHEGKTAADLLRHLVSMEFFSINGTNRKEKIAKLMEKMERQNEFLLTMVWALIVKHEASALVQINPAEMKAMLKELLEQIK